MADIVLRNLEDDLKEKLRLRAASNQRSMNAELRDIVSAALAVSLETVEAAALQLSAEERTEWIERLIDTVLPAPPLHPAWEAEIARRVAEMDAGLVESIPAEKVFAELRAMIEAYERKA